MSEIIMLIALHTLILAGVIGGWVVHVIWKIKRLENNIENLFESINDIPTPEELAKEIVKIKLPLNELPPELMEKMKNLSKILADNNVNSFEQQQNNTKPSNDLYEARGKSTYIG